MIRIGHLAAAGVAVALLAPAAAQVAGNKDPDSWRVCVRSTEAE